jgi:hypothetical protein
MIDLDLLQRVAQDLAKDFWMELGQHIGRIEAESGCESPIESAFLLALTGTCLVDQIQFQVVSADQDINDFPDSPDCVFIFPQANIAEFRCDFLLRHGEYRVVVECDGHDFHERTAYQAERDRSRDRRLQEMGYLIMRFTGREIHREAVRHAIKVLQLLHLPAKTGL